jgi:hypothetical protein
MNLSLHIDVPVIPKRVQECKFSRLCPLKQKIRLRIPAISSQLTS